MKLLKKYFAKNYITQIGNPLEAGYFDDKVHNVHKPLAITISNADISSGCF